MTVKTYSLAMMVIFVSFLGFVVENIWLSLTKGYMDNRNMCMPFLIGYGLTCIVLYALLGSPAEFVPFSSQLFENCSARKLAYFFTVFVLVCVGEIALGSFTERFFGFYYWNYERLPLHITRYTSVPTSLAFAVMITLFMEYCYMPIYNKVCTVSSYRLQLLSVIVFTMLFVDFLSSFKKMHDTHTENQRWVIYTQSTSEHMAFKLHRKFSALK